MDLSKIVDPITFPPKNTDFDSHPETRVTLWESRSPMEKFHHTPGTKNLEIDAPERIRTVSPYLYHTTP